MTVDRTFPGFSQAEASLLSELDRTHWLHPQGDLAAPSGTIPQLIIVSGRGATLTDVEGREYLDGMASLWNVNVGYGREELAAAAAEQMKTLAFSSAYGGFGTAPAIKLAAKLADLAPADYFPLLRKLCDKHGLLLIADEVITGFGRTGRWFALEHWNVQADLMIFAKGITSGYLPLSGVMLTRRVHDVLTSVKGMFAHGFTYSGHPTACAVALRNLQILEEEGLVQRVAERCAYLQAR